MTQGGTLRRLGLTLMLAVLPGLLVACGSDDGRPSEGVIAEGPTSTSSTLASTSNSTSTSTTVRAIRPTTTIPTRTLGTSVVASPTTIAPVPEAPAAPVDPLAGVPRPTSFDPVVVATAVGGIAAFANPPATFNSAGADWTFAAATQFGSPTTFQVLEFSGDWLRVILPIRENGTRAWIHTSQVTLSQHNTRIVVDIGSRRVVVWDGASVVVDTDVVVGKGSTPTPRGAFYVTDVIDTGNPSGPYGPYVLATSARSDAFDFFNGGEPLVGLHGTNAPELLGSASSNGCVRMPNSVASMLAFRVPLGAAVEIV